MIMKYEMKDLVPIVAKLVEGYTSKQFYHIRKSTAVDGSSDLLHP